MKNSLSIAVLLPGSMFTYTLVLAKKKNRRFTDALQFPVVTSCHCGSKGIIRNFCLFVCLVACLLLWSNMDFVQLTFVLSHMEKHRLQ